MKKLLVILLMLAAMNVNAQWEQMSNGMGTDKGVYCFANNGNNIFAGSYNYPNSTGMYRSTNNGDSWTTVNNGLTDLRIFSIVVSGTNIFAATPTGGVFLSTNNGDSWIPVGLASQGVKALAVSGSNLFAGASYYSGVYLSTNNGTNWTTVNNGISNQFINSLTFSGTNLFAGTSTGGLFLTTNFGVNWFAAGLTNQDIYSFAVQGTNIFAGTDAHNVYLSTNNGIIWESVLYNYVYALTVSGQNIFAGTVTGKVFLTTNTGANWIDKSQGLNITSSIQSLFVTNNYIFAGTYSNSVWRRSLTEIIGIQNISTETPSSYSLGQNYPNPFNPTTKIRFSIVNGFPIRTFGNDKVVLKVFDVMGREVQTLVNERLQPGTYEATFDGSMLNSGVYFYKLVTNGFTETKKMLMIK